MKKIIRRLTAFALCAILVMAMPLASAQELFTPEGVLLTVQIVVTLADGTQSDLPVTPVTNTLGNTVYWVDESMLSDDQIAAYYSDLVQAAGIPMIVYNVTLAGLVSYEMLLRLGRIEGVEGIKYTSSTVFDIFRIKEALGQDFAVYSGSDELAVSGLAFGADGIIGSTYNVLTPLFLKLNAQMAAGDVIAARETQKIANKLIFALLARGLMPSLKAPLTLGGRVDGGISRRPFFQLTEEQHEALKAEYRAIKAAHGDLGLDFLKAL